MLFVCALLACVFFVSKVLHSFFSETASIPAPRPKKSGNLSAYWRQIEPEFLELCTLRDTMTLALPNEIDNLANNRGGREIWPNRRSKRIGGDLNCGPSPNMSPRSGKQEVRPKHTTREEEENPPI